LFYCSICSESSASICVWCTKDACGNHLCERCHRCSDCCECDARGHREADFNHVQVNSLDFSEPIMTAHDTVPREILELAPQNVEETGVLAPNLVG
jgi:hypothetical protein